MKKIQLNARVRPECYRAAIQLAKAARLTHEDLVEAAIACLVGTSDKVLNAKREHAQDIAKELQLSFDAPESQTTGLAA